MAAGRDAPGTGGEPAGEHGVAHRGGHRHRVLGAGDGAGQQHGVAAQLHGQGGLGGGADPGVEHHGHGRPGGDELDVVRVEDAQPGADGGAQGHHRGRAQILEAACDGRVVGGVGEDLEAAGHELLGGVEELHDVGQQRVLVRDDLELDPVGLEGLPAELGGQQRVPGGVAPGGVGQDPDVIALQQREEGVALAGGVAAQGHGGQLGAGGQQRLLQGVQRAQAAGAHDQPGAQLDAVEHERVGVRGGHVSLPGRR